MEITNLFFAKRVTQNLMLKLVTLVF